MEYIYVPGWNSYCIAINLSDSTVGLSINGKIVADRIHIKVLNSASTLLLSSTLHVYNEMFTMVNIYNTNLTTASKASANNSPGQILAWNPDVWTHTSIAQFQAKGPLEDIHMQWQSLSFQLVHIFIPN